MKKLVLVSACLLGIKSRYDGKDSLSRELLERQDIIKVPVCPEQMGGLPTPRPQCEIRWRVRDEAPSGEGGSGIADGNAPGGSDVLDGLAGVFTLDGNEDMTKGFLRGAREGLKAAVASGAKHAILKEKSPSCGVNFTVNNGQVVRGRGVFSALLQLEGISVKGA